MGGDVTGERWYEGEDGVRRKVDIVVHAWGSTYALDVAVVDPSAPTSIRMGSAARPDVAARHRGEQKIAYWRCHSSWRPRGVWVRMLTASSTTTLRMSTRPRFTSV